MKIIKKILNILFDPMNAIGSINKTEKLVRTFNKSTFVNYIVSIIITAVILYLIYS